MKRLLSTCRRLTLRLNDLALMGLIGLTVLPGCSGLAPNYTRPELPVAAQFGGAAPATLPVAVNDALALKNTPFATDPVLKPLLEMAIANNRDLRVAVLNIELAQAQLGVRQADLLPSVNAGLGGSRQTTASGGLSSSYTGGLSLTALPAYEVDLFSRLRNLTDAARSQYLASEEARKTVHIGSVSYTHLTLPTIYSV